MGCHELQPRKGGSSRDIATKDYSLDYTVGTGI